MSVVELGVMFTLGLVSSLHCMQMCGPIVLSYSLGGGNSGAPGAAGKTRYFALGHLAYNAGRIITYSALGALAGLAGGTMGMLGRLAGASSVAAMVGGGLMIVAGLFMLDIIPSRALAGILIFRLTSGFMRRVGGLLSTPGVGKRFLLGLALGFLPCGLIYAALLRSLATGSALWGAAAMMAFGLGTAGALIALGLFSSAIRWRLNCWGNRLAAAGVILMGILLFWRGAMPGMLMAGMHAAHCCH
jgi:sulfite exporter TauE/SafE